MGESFYLVLMTRVSRKRTCARACTHTFSLSPPPYMLHTHAHKLTQLTHALTHSQMCRGPGRGAKTNFFSRKGGCSYFIFCWNTFALLHLYVRMYLFLCELKYVRLLILISVSFSFLPPLFFSQQLKIVDDLKRALAESSGVSVSVSAC